MLLSRYSNIQFILELPIKDGVDLINKGFEEIEDSRLYNRWIQGYDRSMSFNEFKRELRIDKIDTTLTEDEILDDVDNILTEFRR